MVHYIRLAVAHLGKIKIDNVLGLFLPITQHR